MNKAVYTPLPIITRVPAWGQLEQFYDKRVQKVLAKYCPKVGSKILASDAVDIFRYVCRMVNYSRGIPPSRPAKFLEVYLREPRFFAELLWTLEQVTFSNRDGSKQTIPTKSASAAYFYRQVGVHDMDKIGKSLGVSPKAAAQALRNQRDAENRITASWKLRLDEESKAQKTRKNV